MRIAAWILVLGLAAGPPVAAEIVGVYTDERINGRPAALPQPGLEGILDSLFEAACVAVELEAPEPVRPEGGGAEGGFPALQAAARRAGAEYLLVSRFESTRSPAGSDRVESRAEYWLLEVSTSRLLARGELAADNDGRREADARRLSFELGAQAAGRAIRSWKEPRAEE